MTKPLKIAKNEPLIGIDYGEKAIGLALGRSGLATPLTTVNGTNLNSAFNEIVRYAIENKVTAFVVGLPLNAQGKETKSSLKVRAFANRLKAYSKRQIFYQNEYATSQNAEGEMLDLEISQKRRRNDDHYAAAIILRRFFEDNS